MTARSVRAGSQPAIDLACDVPGCANYLRVFLDTIFQARADSNRQGWRCRLTPMKPDLDRCPKHVEIDDLAELSQVVEP